MGFYRNYTTPKGREEVISMAGNCMSSGPDEDWDDGAAQEQGNVPEGDVPADSK